MLVREAVWFELNVERCDPVCVLAAVSRIVDFSSVPVRVSGLYAGGSESFGAPREVADLASGRQFESLRVEFHLPMDGKWLGRLDLEFAGTPQIVDGRVTLTDYVCHHIEGYLMFELDPETVEAGWDWLWSAYRELMSLTPLPQPWSLPTTQYGGGLLLDQPGTAATMTHRIPANLFGRTASADPGLHHYGPIVHLSPEAIAAIGAPEDQPDLVPLRSESLAAISGDHGTIVQMPWPIEPGDLQRWRDYLWPALGISTAPTPEALDILDAGLLFPVIPVDVSAKYVVGRDLGHAAFDGVEVVSDKPGQPGTVVLVSEHVQRANGVAPIVDQRFEKRLPRRLNRMRNVIVFANPDAMITPASGLVFLSAIQHGEIAICQIDIGAEEVLRHTIAQHPDVFAPALLWQRDRTEQRSVRSDSWTLSLVTNDKSSGRVETIESVTVSTGSKGKLRFSSAGKLKPRDAFERLTETAGDLFGEALDSPPVLSRWADIYESRMDVERWLRLTYHSLSLADQQHNNRVEIDWNSSDHHRTIVAAATRR